MKLLLVLLALGARQFFPGEFGAGSVGRLSRQWRDLWLGHNAWSPWVSGALIVLLPLLILSVLLYALSSFWHGVFAILLSLAVVGWVLLDRHTPDALLRFQEGWLGRGWTDAEADGQTDLIPQETDMALELAKGRNELLRERLSELFGPLFWFLLLGPVGMLAYYLIRITAELAELQTVGMLARDALFWADWLPARVLALSFALAGNFVETWNYLRGRLLDWAYPPLNLLDEATAAAHPPRFAVSAESSPGAVLVLGLSEVEALLQRALIIWIVLLALHTILA